MTFVRPEKFKDRNFFISHDNASAHEVVVNRQFSTDKRVSTVHHPPRSPDLSRLDSWAFVKLELELKGERLENGIKHRLEKNIDVLKTSKFIARQQCYRRHDRVVKQCPARWHRPNHC